MWTADVSFSPFRNVYEIRLAERTSEGYNVAVRANDGDVEVEHVSVGVEIPVFLSLPADALDAIREAYEESRPRDGDSDLRESLELERERVNKFIDAIVDRLE